MGLFSRKKSRSPLAPLSQPIGAPPIPVDTRPNFSSTHPSQPQFSPPPQHPHSAPLPAYHAPQTSGFTGSDAQTSAFPPAGYVPPPPGWQGAAASMPYQQPPPKPTSIVVNQHYYIMPAPQSNDYVKDCMATSCAMTNMAVGSAVQFTRHAMPGTLCAPREENGWANQWPGQGSSVMNQICERFNDVMTSIDLEKYRGNENKLFVCQQESNSSTSDVSTDGQLVRKSKKDQSTKKDQDQSKGVKVAVASSGISGNYFAKVDLYANSRLPMNLPPLKLYIPTWPLLCLAAQYSERVYDKARGKEKDVHINADSKEGTKAMVIKTVPLAHMNTIVFAIRGTATFMDWAVNLKTDSTSPIGFLDDYGNYCHAGFLSVARKMIKPVAARLRQLLQEDPGRRSYSLLITGHSAGGAVASLLYAHMLATSQAAQSELSSLTGRFKRVHCVTFGTPPVSLLPLQKPSAEGMPEMAKSLFLSFVNEGDPVARADKGYVKSLLELFATPVPALAAKTLAAETLKKAKSSPALRSKVSLMSAKSGKGDNPSKSYSYDSRSGETAPLSGPIWKVPPSTLSMAGRVIVLRAGDPKARLKGKKTVEERLNEGVVAQIATDEQLRTVIWGDPVCHLMRLYAGRLEMLAINSVTAKGH